MPRGLLISVCFTLILFLPICLPAQEPIDVPKAAQEFGRNRPVVQPQPDGLIVCEAEEFAVSGPGWEAKRFGENYYAATFANSFLSRKAFLSAPEQCDETLATIQVQIPAAGRYLALIRYEAAYRFETQFKLTIEQNGQKKLDRSYGARNNLKIWAFSQKLKTEVAWSWGAVENIVWEGHDAFVNLEPGLAKLTLTAGKQTGDAARRNIDLVMLTTDVDQVNQRIEKEAYLPLDGMLTQSGDVWLRVTNTGDKPLKFTGGSGIGGGNWQEHSPYWVHMRNWPKIEINVDPGKTSEWNDVGGTMDSLNDGQWNWTGEGKYKAEFAIKNAAGQMQSIASFDGQGELRLAADCNTRYTRRLRTQDQVLFDLLDYLKKQPVNGKTPTRTTIYASTFDPSPNPAHAAAVNEFKQLFSLADPVASATNGRGMIDVRGVPTEMLAEYCQQLGANAANISVVSLGDEISLPAPAGEAANDGFRQWLQQQKVMPADVDPPAGNDWTKINYNPAAELMASHPGVYYWSKRYQFHYGIQTIKERTDILKKHLPNAAIGANYSPHYPSEHMFLGEVFKWVSVFRADGMTLPWSEDYIWQVPIGTAQMNNINFDLFRAANRGKPDRKILYYVMPHAPNNTPDMWRRLFVGSLGHGMKIVNLFEFRPVQVAYTENHVDEPEMYAMILRSFRELGMFEDIVQDGQVADGQAALWFSETGDIWGDSLGSFAAAKRGLYTAIRHQQMPLDFVVEEDALNGTLDQYKVLYLTDNHVSQAAAKAIGAWVERGGKLWLSAGAGMLDELSRPNKTMRDLAGIEPSSIERPENAQITYLKQDLPFAQPIDKVSWKQEDVVAEMHVFSIRSKFRILDGNQQATFSDGSPAITIRKAGNGEVTYCGFLPGLTYYAPAIPRRPVDRGSTNDAMIHFIPTDFDKHASSLIGKYATAVGRPILCSEPLVESTIIKSAHGIAIPLVNWSGQSIKGLTVTIQTPVPRASITLASGQAVAQAADGDKLMLTLDLDAADVIILR